MIRCPCISVHLLVYDPDGISQIKPRSSSFKAIFFTFSNSLNAFDYILQLELELHFNNPVINIFIKGQHRFSKWNSNSNQRTIWKTVLKFCQNLNWCRSLKLDYLDLYLIHWPITAKPGMWEMPYSEESLVPFDLKSVWAAMEECHKLGLTKSIGVSNFSCKKLENLLSFATIPPSVNQVSPSSIIYPAHFVYFTHLIFHPKQVEMNIAWQQKNLRAYCKAKGIIVTAYSPLGAKGSKWDINQILDNELTKQIAQAHGKTAAQVTIFQIYLCF